MLPSRAVCLVFAALFCGAPAGATEDAQLEERAQRWLPGLAITTAGLWQDRQATASSLERGTIEGESTAAMWSMGVQVSIASPVLLDGGPRLVVHGGFLGIFDTEEPVANETNPGKVTIPARNAGGGAVPLEGIRGRGTAARVETGDFGWTAGIGISLERVVLGRILRVTPSLEYSWQEDRLRGLLGHAEVEGVRPRFCDPSCRVLEIDASESQEFHSLGPGLEIEWEMARFHDFSLTLFSSTQALHVLGDRDLKLRASGTWLSDGMPADRVPPTSTLTATYERDPWHFRAGIGVRLHWLPEAY